MNNDEKAIRARDLHKEIVYLKLQGKNESDQEVIVRREELNKLYQPIKLWSMTKEYNDALTEISKRTNRYCVFYLKDDKWYMSDVCHVKLWARYGQKIEDLIGFDSIKICERSWYYRVNCWPNVLRYIPITDIHLATDEEINAIIEEGLPNSSNLIRIERKPQAVQLEFDFGEL